MACCDCLPLPGNQTLDQCLKEKHCIPTPMNGLKGALRSSQAFLAQLPGIRETFRQRMQEMPNRGSEGLSSGLRNKTQCLNVDEKNLLGAGEMTQLVRFLPHKQHRVRIPSTYTEVEGVLKLSIISLGHRGERLADLWDLLACGCSQTQNKRWRATDKNTEH